MDTDRGLSCALLWKSRLTWDDKAPGLNALPDQVDPFGQVAVDAPAAHAGGRDGHDQLRIEREIAYRCSPSIGYDDADCAQVAK